MKSLILSNQISIRLFLYRFSPLFVFSLSFSLTLSYFCCILHFHAIWTMIMMMMLIWNRFEINQLNTCVKISILFDSIRNYISENTTRMLLCCMRLVSSLFSSSSSPSYFLASHKIVFVIQSHLHIIIIIIIIIIISDTIMLSMYWQSFLFKLK